MKAAFSRRFVHQYAALPEDRKVRFDKQLAFLLTNLRHPSLRAKKYDEARDIQKIYGMEGVQLSPGDVKAFRDKTRLVHTKWAEEIGVDLVRSAGNIVESAR
ncbi:MAG: hypothetical protein Q7W02_10655 [Candidatus Rokubacteria bacterium]|nr:hypothetical protein [Candidatus Rokubacteria bacterium]